MRLALSSELYFTFVVMGEMLKASAFLTCCCSAVISTLLFARLSYFGFHGNIGHVSSNVVCIF